MKYIFSFNGTNGASPIGGLVEGADGKLYGTTNGGGTSNRGTVFKYAPGGKEKVLYNFCSQPNCTDGECPVAKLLQAADGNFYGTTDGGGEPGSCLSCGTVFKITPKGAFTTLYTFCSQPGCADGAGPAGELIQGADGNLYGTTFFG